MCLERRVRGERHAERIGAEHRALADEPDGVRVAGIVERGQAVRPEVELTADAVHPPHEPLLIADRHEVDEFGDPRRTQKTGDEHVRVGPVELLGVDALPGRPDLETPAFGVVQNRAEHARRVEVRQAEPVERAVLADEGGGPQVADDAVVFDRLVGHGAGGPPWVM